MSQAKKNDKKKNKSEEPEVEVLLEDQDKINESIEEYQKKIEELEKHSEELKDNALRAMAEVENIKRRTDKEIKEIKKYALSNFVESLVPVIENLYRSTDHIVDEHKNNDAIIKVIEGIEMTKVEFLKLLEKQGVKRIMPHNGDSFDHNLHQAVSMVPSNDKKANTIYNVIQAGYTINDRLIRPALVVVTS